MIWVSANSNKYHLKFVAVPEYDPFSLGLQHPGLQQNATAKKKSSFRKKQVLMVLISSRTITN